MNDTSSMIVVVKELAKQRKYDEAIAVLDASFSEKLLCAELCVLRAELIELSSAESPYQLSDARAMYEKAIELAPDSDEALYGLGVFHLNVMDNARVALDYLRQAQVVLDKRLEATKHATDQAIAELAESGGGGAPSS